MPVSNRDAASLCKHPQRHLLGPRGLVYAALIVLATVLPASFVAFTPSAFASGNVNFVGTWVPSSGYRWTVTSENHKTGSCVATTILSKSGYHLIGCHVVGNKYAFTITYGPAYRSNNTGIISENTLTGRFKDTNGTVESYSTKRKG